MKNLFYYLGVVKLLLKMFSALGNTLNNNRVKESVAGVIAIAVTKTVFSAASMRES